MTELIFRHLNSHVDTWIGIQTLGSISRHSNSSTSCQDIHSSVSLLAHEPVDFNV